jgi:hypothetical protein
LITKSLQLQNSQERSLYPGFVYTSQFFTDTGRQFARKKAHGKLFPRAKSSAI